MVTLEDIVRWNRRTWEVRERLAPRWRTRWMDEESLLVDEEWALRYALTECAGEANEVILRQKYPEDGRSNDRNVDMNLELGQCLMMLETALGPDVEADPDRLEDLGRALDTYNDTNDPYLAISTLSSVVAFGLRCAEFGIPSSGYVIAAIMILAGIVDADAALERALSYQVAKWGDGDAKDE